MTQGLTKSPPWNLPGPFLWASPYSSGSSLSPACLATCRDQSSRCLLAPQTPSASLLPTSIHSRIHSIIYPLDQY